MNNFESLHPALKHHIVNSLGWKDLRPFQDSAIPHVLSGRKNGVRRFSHTFKDSREFMEWSQRLVHLPDEGSDK